MIIYKFNDLDFFIVILDLYFFFFKNSVAKNHIASREPKMAEGNIREQFEAYGNQRHSEYRHRKQWDLFGLRLLL